MVEIFSFASIAFGFRATPYSSIFRKTDFDDLVSFVLSPLFLDEEDDDDGDFSSANSDGDILEARCWKREELSANGLIAGATGLKALVQPSMEAAAQVARKMNVLVMLYALSMIMTIIIQWLLSL
jgi:hypothetical protein